MEIRNEMLNEIRSLESKINTQMNANKAESLLNLEEINKKIKHLTDDNKSLLEMIISYKIKGEKIFEFDNFRKKVDDMLIAHEVRINNASEEMKAMKTKYDKIVVDNLEVPGFIGASCQYKNLSEYLTININDTVKLKNEKEILKKDSKELKTKFDTFFKNIVNLIDNSVVRCKEYTDSKQRDLESLLNVKLKEFNEKTLDIKANICKVQMDTDKIIQSIKKELEYHKRLIDELDEKLLSTEEKINEKINGLDKEKNEIRSDILDIKNNNTNFSKELSDIKDSIQNIRNIMKVNTKRKSMPALNLNFLANSSFTPNKFFNANNQIKKNLQNGTKHRLSIIETSPNKIIKSQSPNKRPRHPVLDENIEISISDDDSSSSSSKNSDNNNNNNVKGNDSVNMNNSIINRVKNESALPSIEKSFAETGKCVNKKNINESQKIKLEPVNSSFETYKKNIKEYENIKFEDSKKNVVTITNEENKTNNLMKKCNEASTIPVKNSQIIDVSNNSLNKIYLQYDSCNSNSNNNNSHNFYYSNLRVLKNLKSNIIKKDNVDINYKIVNLELDKKVVFPSKPAGLIAMENRRNKNKNILKDDFLSPSINDIIKNQKKFTNTRKKYLSRRDMNNSRYFMKNFGKTATNSFNKRSLEYSNTARSNNKIILNEISSGKNNVQNNKFMFHTEYSE